MGIVTSAVGTLSNLLVFIGTLVLRHLGGGAKLTNVRPEPSSLPILPLTCSTCEESAETLHSSS